MKSTWNVTKETQFRWLEMNRTSTASNEIETTPEGQKNSAY